MPDLIAQLLAWRAAQPLFKDAETAVKAQLMEQMSSTQSVTVGNKKGDGTITLVQDEPVASIEDQDQLEGFCILEGSKADDTQITDHDAAVEVLRKVAPHLLEDRTVVPQWAVNNALKRAEKGENIPGVLVREKAPYLRCLPSAALKERVQQELSGGLPQIGGGQ